MTMLPDEAVLVERARQGDRAALEALLTKYQGRIFRFGLRMCRDEHDAQEVLQETLLALTKGIADFRGASSLSTWLFTVARSFCIKQRRRSKHAPSPADVTSLSGARVEARLASSAPLPDERSAERELQGALGDAIAALEPKYREVLLLRDVEEMSAAEVAEVLGISVDATKSRLHRARAQVRKSLAPPAAPPRKTCPDVVALLSRKVEGDISAATCAELERHLQGCRRCDDACQSFKRTLALCRSVPAEPVPPHVKAAVRDAVRQIVDRAARATP